jgi:hypothetical protein
MRCIDPPIINDRTSEYYSSLHEAYYDPDTISGDVFKIQAVVLTENLDLDRNISFTFEGGYNCNHSDIIGITTLDGTITISDGTVNIQNLVYKAPDLIVESITTDPVAPAPGETVDVTVTVRNQGSADATDTFFIIFIKEPADIFGCTIDGLAAGATTTCVGVATFYEIGTFDMWAFADYDLTVTESNEDNNELVETITIVEGPDLIVQGISTDPVFPGPGETVNVTVTVRNQAAGDATNSFWIDFYKNLAAPPGAVVGDIDCPIDSLAAGATTTCSGTVSYFAEGTYTMWAQVDTDQDVIESNEDNNVFGPQSICVINGGEIQKLVAWYYWSILDRCPESEGAEYWAAEIERIVSLGIDIKEGFIALGKEFFNSVEYIALNKSDVQYLADLYWTFLGRGPDPGGETFWLGQLAGGLTRNMVLNNFVFSSEFRAYMIGKFGDSGVRPEYNLVNDQYRGILSRLPEDGGYIFWLGHMQTAQCTGDAAVRDLTNEIGLLFITSPEYMDKGRSNGEFLEDMYDAILRRAPDLSGHLFWLGLLNSGALSREEVLQEFVNSVEFQVRVQEVIDAGCILP